MDLARCALTCAYLLRTRRPSAAPSHQRALPRFFSSMGRSALIHFTGIPFIGLVSPSLLLSWYPRDLTAGAETGLSCFHDGCLTIPRPLGRRVLRGCTSKFLTPFRGLRPPTRARLPVGPLRGNVWRRGRLRFMLRTGELHPPEEGSTRASTPRSPRTPAACYKGALVPPLAGLPPASHRELPGRAVWQRFLHFAAKSPNAAVRRRNV